jgi:hypothetical protein
MKSRLIAVAIHKRVICGNERFAPVAAIGRPYPLAKFRPGSRGTFVAILVLA